MRFLDDGVTNPGDFSDYPVGFWRIGRVQRGGGFGKWRRLCLTYRPIELGLAGQPTVRTRSCCGGDLGSRQGGSPLRTLKSATLCMAKRGGAGLRVCHGLGDWTRNRPMTLSAGPVPNEG